MPDIDQFKDQAENAAEPVTEKAQGATEGLKGKLDVNGDGKTDVEDIKHLAKEASDKVKGLFSKS